MKGNKNYSVSRQTAQLVSIYGELLALHQKTVEALSIEYRDTAAIIIGSQFKQPYDELRKALLRIISQSISDHLAEPQSRKI